MDPTAPLLEFGDLEPPRCWGQYSNVKMLKQAIVVTEGAVCCPNCCGESKEHSHMIPRHVVVDYDVDSKTFCWCCGDKYKVINLRLITSQDKEVELAGGGTARVPVEHFFHLPFDVADSLDKTALSQYVYGPVAAAGGRLHMASHLIDDGLADKMDLRLDLLSNDVTDESAQLTRNEDYKVFREGCCSYTDVSFFEGHMGLNYRNLSYDTPPAVCMSACATGCCTLVNGCKEKKCRVPDCCWMQEHNMTVPRFNVVNFEVNLNKYCCCCHTNTIDVITTDKNTTSFPLIGAVQTPIVHSLRYDGDLNTDFLRAWAFGDLVRMGDKAHGASLLINNDKAEKIQIKEELNKLLSAPGTVTMAVPVDAYVVKGMNDELFQSFFDRYDLDQSGTMNSQKELQQLTTNLIIRLEITCSVDDIQEKVAAVGEMDWDIQQTREWFCKEFGTPTGGGGKKQKKGPDMGLKFQQVGKEEVDAIFAKANEINEKFIIGTMHTLDEIKAACTNAVNTQDASALDGTPEKLEGIAEELKKIPDQIKHIGEEAQGVELSMMDKAMMAPKVLANCQELAKVGDNAGKVAKEVEAATKSVAEATAAAAKAAVGK